MPNPVIPSAHPGPALLPLRQTWQWCVGSVQAAQAWRADWQAPLALAHQDLASRQVCFHGCEMTT